MKLFEFRSLSQIFLMGVLLVSVPLLLGTVLTFVYIEQMSGDSRRLVVRSLEIGRETEKLMNHMQELNRTAQQYMVVRDDELYDLYTRKHTRLIEILDWLELLVDKPEASQLLKEIRSVSNAAFEQVREAANGSRSELDEDNLQALVELSQGLSFFSNTAIRNQLDMAARKVETARVVLYWIWGISLMFIVLFLGLFAWFIGKPVKNIDAHIRRLGQGRFDEPIAIEGPADIKRLGDRLDWLRGRLGEIDEVKERFFREMSHQLKTPLASIREGADLLIDESGYKTLGDQREVLKLLHNNSVELQRMLDNMLKFSAWRGDPRELYKECFRIRDVMDSVVQRVRVSLLSHNLRIRLECPDDLQVTLDREKCRVVLDNLVSNAVKFSPDQGEIVVSAAAEGRRLRLEVVDEGPGVPEEERGRIFDLFHLGEGPSGNSSRGTGVGLALVKAYAEVHGGWVTVERASKGGARFVVTVPGGVS